MRTVVQRVASASVTIGGRTVSQIGQGLLILLAVESEDTGRDVEWLSGKIARLRVFSDDQGLMNRSLGDTDGEALVVSQFTLLASTKKGNRPSYCNAARPEIAIPLYEAFIQRLEADLGKPVATGEFGAEMRVALVNDGPVTVIIDTRRKE
ncbi:MAG TPA: D-aminoacyl-tRNA deacylase [Candidatus Paceibacterota bacterium]|nr:D-aminoacyl-tRNA deacylase [Candidatus Paceibacterota bacterium]